MKPAGLAVLMACGLTLDLPGCAPRTTETFTLSLVGTNDLHGGILAVEGRGGLTLLDGYVSNLRAARENDGGAVLLLDAGDLLQGTLESNLNEGSTVIDAYNALGYTAATIGNHEFDYGPEGGASVARAGDNPRGALEARLRQARFPWLAANILDVTTGRPAAWPNVTPSTTLTINGVHVGVVGLLTEPALVLSVAANVAGLAMAPLAPTLEAEALALRQRGATIVIALAHAGGKCTQTLDPQDLTSCEPNAEIFELARQLPTGLVDAIVAGHRHEPIAHEVNSVPIIQSYAQGRAFGRIDFIVDRTTGRAQAHRIFQPQDVCARVKSGTAGCAAPGVADAAPAQYEGRDVTPSARIAALLQPAVDAATQLKSKPLGAALTAPLKYTDFSESPVGDLQADWMRAIVPGADAALTNSAGLRANLREGPLTFGGLYELLPFDNQRVTIALTGAQLRTVVAANMKVRGSMVVLSGIRAAVTCENGDVAVALRRESGRPVGDAEVLTVVTTDFLVTGGDNFLTPVLPVRVIDTGNLLRDELATTIGRLGGPWGAERLSLPPRITHPGTRPVTCPGVAANLQVR